jgi:hypothetical protein
MTKVIWVKFAVGAFLVIETAVFVASCERQSYKTVHFLPQHRAATLPAPADVGSEQTTEPLSVMTSVQRENLSDSSTPPAASTDTQLDSRIDLSGITIGTPFGQVIEILRNSTHPPLNIVVFWNDLRDNALIDRQTPVGAEPISGVSLRKNLEILLASLPTKLDYTISDGVIVIATEKILPKKMQRRTYDITDLSSKPADYYSPTD